MRDTMPILLLIAGILLVYAGISQENTGAYIGNVLTGLCCMMYAVLCWMDGDDV